MDEILKKLSDHNIVLEPLSLKELSQLEGQLEVNFPKAYKEFLLAMGKGAGIYMKGSDVFYDTIPDLKDASQELILDNNFLTLPPNSFVFWMHQGYQLAFFKLNEGENPPVYYYSEGLGLNDFMREKSFVDFLKMQLKMSSID